MAMALLGTATMAGAASPTAVSFTTVTPRAAAAATWTVNFTPATAVTAGSGGTVSVTFPTGFVIPTIPTITTTGTGFSGTCTANTAATTGQTVLVTLNAACGLTVNPAVMTIAGITNPAVGLYPAAGFTVATSADTAAAATSDVRIYEAALAAPTVTNTGNGTATVSYVTDGSPLAVTASYAVASVPTLTLTSCNYTNADVAGTPTTHSCAVTGMTSGVSYAFTVTQTPATGVTAATPGSVSSVASSALGTPTATVFGSGAVTVSFVSDGAANLYTVTSSPAGGTCAVGGTPLAAGATSCLVTGLTDGTSYTFTVTPSGGTTTSTVSAPSNAVKPGAILAAPVLANAGANKVNASFVADGVATLYTVQAYTTSALTTQVSGGVCYFSNGTAPAKGTALNCTVSTGTTGLVTGQTYYFTVSPSGGNDTAATSAATSIVSADQISAPLATNAGNGSVAVSFAANGAATTYVVQAYTAAIPGTALTNRLCTIASATPPTGLQTCTVTGLTNGTLYVFDVTPSGGTNTNAKTAQSTSVAPSAALGTISLVTAGPGAVTVTFTPDGTATVYTVTANAAPTAVPSTYSSCVVTNTTTPPVSTATQSCTVTGLTPGGTYTFTVTPSGNGTTSSSTTSNAITTAVGVGTPVATADGSGAIKVTFGTDGVATKYVVTSTPGSLTCTLSATTALTGTQNCTVTGLTNGTSYTFTVTASGNGSTSGTSVASNAVIAGAGLATPTVTTAGYQSVAVSFTADGVATLYTVQAYTAAAPTVAVAGATCFVGNTTTPPTGAQSCTVKGLVNGTPYVFDVTPSGHNTSSTVSPKSASVTPTAALGTPTVANAGSGAVKVTFTADGVASAYTVTSSPAGGSCVVANTTTAPSGVQTCTVTGLTNGSNYSFTVTPSGNGTNSTASTSSTILVGVNFLAAPTAMWSASGSADVSFAADGVASTYVVTANLALSPYTASGTCSVANSTTPPKGTQTCTVTGLTVGTSYTFTVTPSGNGTTSLTSPASAPFLASATAVPPVAPSAVTAKGAAGSVVVNWVAPTNTGGSPITGYMVTATAGNVTTSCGTVAATATTCTIKGLMANTAYAVTVAAMTALGTSPVATATATTLGAATGGTNLHTTGAHGYAVVGRTVVITITGGGFYGQPKLTSTAVGVRAVVIRDNGKMLTVRVTTTSVRARGWHTFTIRLANGKMAKVNYLTK
ncbi:MAG: beta strand repeat-containing protein [Acidimicrobiales bacterium]